MSQLTAPASPFLAELSERGLVHQITHSDALALRMQEPVALYCGFDPTRDSLTIGNLVALTLLRRFQLAGHKPYVLLGGGTGLIGDPSGKDAERQLNSPEVVRENVLGQRAIFEKFLDFEGENAAVLLNNADWLEKLGYIEVLRDVGKHFSVNMMMQKDSVRLRLESRDQGLSYTEFSYMILQSYDYAYLADKYGIQLQIGGSDQWGNIVSGVDLTRRLHQKEVFGLTAPLLTKSDGGKFGKTESGAVWLSRKYTSPYAFYQFWMNAADADVGRFLRVFSFRPLEEIEALLSEQEANPGARRAQRELAEELTRLLHGEEGLQEARLATEALFSGDVRGLSAQLLEEVFAGAPTSELPREQWQGEGKLLVDLLVETGVTKSKREAREFLQSGAIRINGDPQSAEARIQEGDLLHGQFLLVRRGKKTWHVIRSRD